MKGKRRENFVSAIIFLTLLCVPAILRAEHPAHPNPLMEEMLILDKTFQEVVSAVVLGDGARVRKALEAMHGTMEKTHEAVHSGALKLPRNAHRMKEFEKLDMRFHHGLEALSRAAAKDNQTAMLALTKKLLDGCVNCHRIFRK